MDGQGGARAYRKRLTIELLPEEEERARRWRIAAIRVGKTLRDWLTEAADEKEARQRNGGH